jgi:hypothetical protein
LTHRWLNAVDRERFDRLVDDAKRDIADRIWVFGDDLTDRAVGTLT